MQAATPPDQPNLESRVHGDCTRQSDNRLSSSPSKTKCINLKAHLQLVCTQLPAAAGSSCCSPSRPSSLICTACSGCCGACWASVLLAPAAAAAALGAWSAPDFMDAVLPAPAKLTRLAAAAVLSDRPRGGADAGSTPSHGLEQSLIVMLHIQSQQQCTVRFVVLFDSVSRLGYVSCTVLLGSTDVACIGATCGGLLFLPGLHIVCRHFIVPSRNHPWVCL